MTGKKVDVTALEETMDEVVETLDLAEQAAGYVRKESTDPMDQARAAAVQKQAEAMLDAAEQAAAGDRPQRSNPSPLPGMRRPPSLIN
ncbi:hypothetical protein [Azospirillum brasilense]|uniref:Uncharacterized protein n=1 Tax=Azospirillum brasilense TaxID=192 RepID=A0A6L3B7P8_AZOBR|nr:hypothetical protein [Azospirillum brasilense]KAA0688616.1 hypothetical protein DS837_02530 [Azospirillum brasilense]